MRTLASLLALAGLAAGPASAASVGTDDARTGVPLSVAKRLNGVSQSPSMGDAPLSGIPMRQATVGLGNRQPGPTNPEASAVNRSNVPLVHAKRP